MTDQEALKQIYHQNLDRDIIAYLAETNGILLEQAMDIYYRSKLSVQISEGTYGMDNLDYKYLAEDLMENESELFRC